MMQAAADARSLWYGPTDRMVPAGDLTLWEILLGGYPELAVDNVSEVHKLKYRSESLRIGAELATFLI